MINNVILEDTTLRDGEQSPSLAFGKKAKIEIYQKLVATGVQWIEAGIPAMKGSEATTLKEINEMAFSDNVNVIAWNRGVLEDIKFSLSLGFKAIHIGLPTSNIHLQNSVKKDRNWLLSQSLDLIKYAKDKGIFVSISAEDVGRTELSFLEDYACHVQESGADRLRLSDTIGILTPEMYKNIITNIKTVAKIDLQCHAHNDFGLAVANTIAGIIAGAKYFHVTVNAIGERAGMPDLAQVTLALKQLYNIDLGIKTEKLKELAEIVAKHTNSTLYPWQPITGSRVFHHESGIHARATIQNYNTFEPFPPELVGGERRIIIGKHSGKAAIKFILEELGIHNPDDSLLSACLIEIREKSIQKQSSITHEELIVIYNNLLIEV